MKAILCATLVALSAGAASAQGPDTAAARAAGRKYSAWLFAGEADSVYARLTPRMREVIPEPARLAAMSRQLGAETALQEERIEPLAGAVGYTRVVTTASAPGPVQMQWVITPVGEVAGLTVRPVPRAVPSRHEARATLTPLRLPFEGDWSVVWGGRTVAENYHAATRDQRFAYDLLVRQDGSTHTGDGSRLDQFHCWGRPILAPADGLVAAAVDGIEDTPPGGRNTAAPAGNHVVLDFGNGEFGLLAHLRSGSVSVRPGERVRAGQPIGVCGNSGNSSEPHLHFHLQDRAELGAAAEGLPAQFQGYVADGSPVDRGEPRRGQVISPGA